MKRTTNIKLRKGKSLAEISLGETWDLNVPVSLNDDETLNRVKILIELGYRHIALNYEIEVPKDNRPVRLPSQTAYNSLISQLTNIPNEVKLYSRLTLTSEDMSVARVLRDSNAAHFDFIALRPLSEPLLTSCCEGQVPVDIISFDVTQWTPLSLRQSLIHASGLVCELNYCPMIRDQSTRCATIAFAQVLTARTKGGGKGYFALSGESRTPMELRPPADIANLAAFLGLTARDGWGAIVDAPQAARRRALSRRGILGIEFVKVVKDVTSAEENVGQPKPKKAKASVKK